MATCAEILRSEFPEIDGQVFDYVTGKPNRINTLGRPKWKSGRGRLREGSARAATRPLLCVTSSPEGALGLEPGLESRFQRQTPCVFILPGI